MMTFGRAVQQAKTGKHIQYENWSENEYVVCLYQIFPVADGMCLAKITDDNFILPWMPTEDEMLSGKWKIRESTRDLDRSITSSVICSIAPTIISKLAKKMAAEYVTEENLIKLQTKLQEYITQLTDAIPTQIDDNLVDAIEEAATGKKSKVLYTFVTAITAYIEETENEYDDWLLPFLNAYLELIDTEDTATPTEESTTEDSE